MTTNERITRTAYEFAAGLHASPTRPGFCLQLVRLIVETALGLPAFEFYRDLERVERAPGDDQDPWARDVERTFRNRGWAVLTPEDGKRYVPPIAILAGAEPGSILHRWDAAKTTSGTFVGHIGILLHGGLVIENVNPIYRKRAFQATQNPTLHLTPLASFATTLVTTYQAS